MRLLKRGQAIAPAVQGTRIERNLIDTEKILKNVGLSGWKTTTVAIPGGKLEA
jgi:hypothetical protein